MNVTHERPSVLLADVKLLRAWRKQHRKRVPGYQYSHAYKAHRWDGYHYPGRVYNGVLALGRGMLARLRRELGSELVVDCPWRDRCPTLQFSTAQLQTLRDYQAESIVQACTHEWGQIALATNAGKGAIIALLAQAAQQAGVNTLILCDEVSVYQALEEEVQKWTGASVAYARAGGDTPIMGCVTAGTQAKPRASIVLAMAPTLYNRLHPLCPNRSEEWHNKNCKLCRNGRTDDTEWLQWCKRFGMVLADEADKATADTWQSVLAACTSSVWRLGFSGTFPDPNSLAGVILEEHIGPQLVQVGNMDLVQRGISAQPLVELYPFDHPQYEMPDEYEPSQVRRILYETGVLYNEARHAFVAELLDTDMPNAIIVNRVAHGQALADAIPGAVFLHGADSKAAREQVLARFKAGEFTTLIATKILDRGTNLLGHTVGLIFASGEGSNRQTLQRIGRGLRRAGGKEFVYIRDVVDRGNKYFNKATRRRVELYNAQGFAVRIFAQPADRKIGKK